MKARRSAPTWTWKVDGSRALHEVSAEIESASLKLSDALARGFHKLGLHRAAHVFELPNQPHA